MKIKTLKLTHPLIYKRALECQVEQGNKPNDKLNLDEAFRFIETKEKRIWGHVSDGNFTPFYEFHKPKPTEGETTEFISIPLSEYNDLKAAIKILNEIIK